MSTICMGAHRIQGYGLILNFQVHIPGLGNGIRDEDIIKIGKDIILDHINSHVWSWYANNVNRKGYRIASIESILCDSLNNRIITPQFFWDKLR